MPTDMYLHPVLPTARCLHPVLDASNMRDLSNMPYACGQYIPQRGYTMNTYNELPPSHKLAPRTLSTYYVSLLSFLDAKIHFVVVHAIDEDCARHYL